MPAPKRTDHERRANSICIGKSACLADGHFASSVGLERVGADRCTSSESFTLDYAPRRRRRRRRWRPRRRACGKRAGIIIRFAHDVVTTVPTTVAHHYDSRSDLRWRREKPKLAAEEKTSQIFAVSACRSCDIISQDRITKTTEPQV